MAREALGALKGCPFCGAPAKVEKERSFHWNARCDSCGTMVTRETEEDAVKAWNERIKIERGQKKRKQDTEKLCPFRIFQEDVAPFAVGRGNMRVQHFYPCEGEKCMAFDLFSERCGRMNHGAVEGNDRMRSMSRRV